MRYAAWDPDERTWDAGPYVDWLELHAVELPDGARRFATEPSHYDYRAYRTIDSDLAPGTGLCTKDLLLVDVSMSDVGGAQVILRLLFPGFDPVVTRAHDLVLTYSDVTDLSIVVRPGSPHREGMAMSHLLIDEVVPTESGIRHELGFASGGVVVCAMDLRATWR